MTKIACADMGMDCPFVAEGETMEQAMGALQHHGDEVHADAIKEMMANGMTEEQMMEKMKSVAKEA
jgi:predicted small metal-binding protein